MEPDLNPEFGLTLNFDQGLLDDLNELRDHFGYENHAQVLGYGISCLLAIKAGAKLTMTADSLKNIKVVNAKPKVQGLENPESSQDNIVELEDIQGE